MVNENIPAHLFLELYSQFTPVTLIHDFGEEYKKALRIRAEDDPRHLDILNINNGDSLRVYTDPAGLSDLRKSDLLYYKKLNAGRITKANVIEELGIKKLEMSAMISADVLRKKYSKRHSSIWGFIRDKKGRIPVSVGGHVTPEGDVVVTKVIMSYDRVGLWGY